MDIIEQLKTDRLVDLLPTLKRNNYVKLINSWRNEDKIRQLLLEQLSGDYISMGNGVYILMDDSDYEGLLALRGMKMLDEELDEKLQINYERR